MKIKFALFLLVGYISNLSAQEMYVSVVSYRPNGEGCLDRKLKIDTITSSREYSELRKNFYKVNNASSADFYLLSPGKPAVIYEFKTRIEGFTCQYLAHGIAYGKDLEEAKGKMHEAASNKKIFLSNPSVVVNWDKPKADKPVVAKASSGTSNAPTTKTTVNPSPKKPGNVQIKEETTRPKNNVQEYTYTRKGIVVKMTKTTSTTGKSNLLLRITNFTGAQKALVYASANGKSIISPGWLQIGGTLSVSLSNAENIPYVHFLLFELTEDDKEESYFDLFKSWVKDASGIQPSPNGLPVDKTVSLPCMCVRG